jgi:hypothetical protein
MVLMGVSACLVALGTPAAQAERIQEIILYDDVRIEVIAEGRGPTVVLLPSRGRDSRSRRPRGIAPGSTSETTSR